MRCKRRRICRFLRIDDGWWVSEWTRSGRLIRSRLWTCSKKLFRRCRRVRRCRWRVCNGRLTCRCRGSLWSGDCSSRFRCSCNKGCCTRVDRRNGVGGGRGCSWCHACKHGYGAIQSINGKQIGITACVSRVGCTRLVTRWISSRTDRLGPGDEAIAVIAWIKKSAIAGRDKREYGHSPPSSSPKNVYPAQVVAQL